MGPNLKGKRVAPRGTNSFLSELTLKSMEMAELLPLKVYPFYPMAPNFQQCIHVCTNFYYNIIIICAKNPTQNNITTKAGEETATRGHYATPTV